jgi:hypothetical protein
LRAAVRHPAVDKTGARNIASRIAFGVPDRSMFGCAGAARVLHSFRQKKECQRCPPREDGLRRRPLLPRAQGPLSAVDELAGHLDAFIEFLDRHRDYLIETGLPPGLPHRGSCPTPS